MSFTFNPSEQDKSEGLVPLEIDLSRFIALNRKSCHFISPHSPDSSTLETFRHYDRIYGAESLVPFSVIAVDDAVPKDNPEFLGVLDGRKRLSWLARQGEKTVPVLVPKTDYDMIKKLIGARHPAYDLGNYPKSVNAVTSSSGQTVS